MSSAIAGGGLSRSDAWNFSLLLGCILVLAPFGVDVAHAKAPGKQHCHGKVCHRVMTLGQTRAALGKVHYLMASHYDHCRRDRYNPCGLTSSGEVFRPDTPDNTASAIHPDGTILLLRNAQNGKSAVVRVNNFGPFWGNRKLDVSRATARKLGFAHRGVARLEVMVVYAPTPREARYRAHRRYAPVAGFLGETATIAHAVLAYEAEMQRNQQPYHVAGALRLAHATATIPPALPRRSVAFAGMPPNPPDHALPTTPQAAALSRSEPRLAISAPALALPRRPRSDRVAMALPRRPTKPRLAVALPRRPSRPAVVVALPRRPTVETRRHLAQATPAWPSRSLAPRTRPRPVSPRR